MDKNKNIGLSEETLSKMRNAFVMDNDEEIRISMAMNMYDDKKEQPVSKPIELLTFNGQDPDEICYLLLLYVYRQDENDYFDDEMRHWQIKIGRQRTYDYLKLLLESDTIDVYKSFIISDTSSLGSSLNIYDFMHHVREESKVIDNTNFDITHWYEDDKNYLHSTLLDVTDTDFIYSEEGE